MRDQAQPVPSGSSTQLTQQHQQCITRTSSKKFLLLNCIQYVKSATNLNHSSTLMSAAVAGVSAEGVEGDD
eukprot:6181555-Pleurochrysis_carterae.AAC.8